MTPSQFHGLLAALFLIGACNCPHKNTLRTSFMLGLAVAAALKFFLS